MSAAFDLQEAVESIRNSKLEVLRREGSCYLVRLIEESGPSRPWMMPCEDVDFLPAEKVIRPEVSA